MNPVLLSTFKATALPSLAAATLPDRSKKFATLERKTAISICCYKIKQNKCRRNDQVNHAKDHAWAQICAKQVAPSKSCHVKQGTCQASCAMSCPSCKSCHSCHVQTCHPKHVHAMSCHGNHVTQNCQIHNFCQKKHKHVLEICVVIINKKFD